MNFNSPDILVVDNYDSFTFNLVQIIKEHGGCGFDVIPSDKVNVNNASRYNAILFSPGPGVPSDFPVMAELLSMFYHQKSFLGICLGHQAIAEFFGIKLYRLARVNHGVKAAIVVTDSADYLFKGLPSRFDAGLYHSWAIVPETDFELSLKNIHVTAISADGVIMAIRHIQYNIRGLQFHPESHISIYGREIIHNWIDNMLPGNAMDSELH